MTWQDEVRKQSYNFGYLQWGGPGPNNEQLYAGVNGQRMRLTGLTVPELGGINPVQARDVTRLQAYQIISRTIDPPDLATATLELMQKKGRSIPRAVYKGLCPFNALVYVTDCKAPGDVVAGWDNIIHILENVLITDKDMGDLVTTDTDEFSMNSLSITLADYYVVGSLGFSELNGPNVSLEIVDAAFGGSQACGNCGIENDGSQWQYFLQKGDGYGTPPTVFYSIDGGGSWNSSVITGALGTTTVSAMKIVGNAIVVFSPSANGYYWTRINGYTGAPGAWSLVTSGFQTNGFPRDAVVLSPVETIIVGDQGWIYKLSSPGQAVRTVRTGGSGEPDLNRVAADRGGENLVAVGDSGTVLFSFTRGQYWQASSETPTADDLTAVAVSGANSAWVGSDAGDLYYTLTRGESAWSDYGFTPPVAAATLITDIVQATPSVVHVAYSTAEGGGSGYLASSWNGGRDFAFSRDDNQARMINFPTVDRINRLAVPTTNDGTLNSNVMLGAALGGAGYDGAALIGIATRF